MALPTNAATTFTQIGQREDLSDMIYNIAPTATPIMTAIGKSKADAVNHEWQTDSLASQDTANAQLQGDDATMDAVVPTVRLGNRTQISRKTAAITGTVEAVERAGRGSEMDYQIVKKTKELKRDMEGIITSNQAKVTGNATTAPKLAGMLSWIKTNTSAGSGGSDPATADGAATRTDGTQRTMTEAMLKTVLAACFTAGGEPTKAFVGASVKQTISGFTGGSTRFDKSEDKSLTAAVDVYRGDFGDLDIVPSRFHRSRDCLILDPSLWAVSYLRPLATTVLAKTGDSEKKMLITEYTLEAKNEAGSGGVFDLS